jgi:hypothetical protein
VFDECSTITDVTIAAGGGQQSMFSNCDHVVNLSILATDVSSEAWTGCTSLQHLEVGNNVVSIGKQAFKNCPQLATVSLGGSVLTIGAEAFADCSSLTAIALGSKLDYLGKDVFSGCHALTAATVPSPLPRPIGDVFNCSILASVSFLGSVTSIADDALRGCTSVASVHLFDNVTSIGEYAFAQCSSLFIISMSSSIQQIGAGAFRDCSSITGLSLSDTLVSIGRGAFRGCTSLEYMELPPEVSEIADFTFYGCTALKNLTVRGLGRRLDKGGVSQITYIGEYAFHDCAHLEKIDIGESVTSVRNNAFAGCSSLSSTPSLNRLTSLEDYVFKDCAGLSQVLIPDGITAIHEGAFYRCSSLSRLDWGVNLESIDNHTITIGKYAFRYCSSLRDLSIPASVVWIDEDAFQNTGLDQATIFPREGRIIDESAFPSVIKTGCTRGFELTLKGCECPEGSMFKATNGKCNPCEKHFHCPGGFSDPGLNDLSIVDTTVEVEMGFMTLEDEPFSVYQCVDTLRCEGNRPVLSPMCTAGFDSAIARCATCKPDMYLDVETCQQCTEVAMEFVVGKMILCGVAQLLFNIAFYINVNGPKASSQGTMESLIDFVQMVQIVSRLDIVPPPFLQWFFDLLSILTVPGIFKSLSFKPECTLGTFAAISCSKYCNRHRRRLYSSRTLRSCKLCSFCPGGL